MALRVVFVCTGNICRSPIAEKVFAHELAAAGLADGVTVASVGLGPWHVGEAADARAVALLQAEGYDHDHVARQIDDGTLRADLLVALDRGHHRALRRSVADPERVRLLRSFDPGSPPDADVPDPYYGGDEGFTEVLTMVRAAVPGLLDWVAASRGSRPTGSVIQAAAGQAEAGPRTGRTRPGRQRSQGPGGRGERGRDPRYTA